MGARGSGARDGPPGEPAPWLGFCHSMHCADEAGARTRGLASADILRGFAFAVTRVIAVCELFFFQARVGDGHRR